MTQIDQFESVFRAADKPRFVRQPVDIRSVLVVTDLDEYQAKLFGNRMRNFLRVLDGAETWHDGRDEESTTVGQLLELVEAHRPDLICSYRNLHSGGWRWPHSLGEHLDVLTQATSTPVLVVPRPDDADAFEAATANTRSVMAITDHLAGDHRLVNYAVEFTASDGTLCLSHIESEAVFERYIAAIAKIESIETDNARETILERLLKDPRDYIDSCRRVLAQARLPIEIETQVTLGRRVADYKALVDEHQVDLLVLNTKDDDQQAMHGRAYPLAIELRKTSILML